MPRIIEKQVSAHAEASAVRAETTAQLRPIQQKTPLHVRSAELRALYPLPASTGLKTDKAVSDELSSD